MIEISSPHRRWTAIGLTFLFATAAHAGGPLSHDEIAMLRAGHGDVVEMSFNREVPASPRVFGDVQYDFLGFVGETSSLAEPRIGELRYFDPSRQMQRPDPYAARVTDALGRVWVRSGAGQGADLPMAYPADPTENGDEWETWRADSWTQWNCDNDPWPPSYELSEWDGNDTNPSSNGGYDEFERAAVFVDLESVGNIELGACSGFLVREPGGSNNSKWVVTAAHCVEAFSDSGVGLGYETNPSTLTVRKAQGTSPRSVVSISVPAAWGWSTYADYSDDVAVLELSSPFPYAVPPFDGGNSTSFLISTAGTTTVENIDPVLRTVAPVWDNGFTDSNGDDACDIPNPTSHSISKMFSNYTGEIRSVNSERIRFVGDRSGGMSGGGLYYCPSGGSSTCNSGETAYAYGVHVGWNTVKLRVVAPRLSRWSTWIHNTID